MADNVSKRKTSRQMAQERLDAAKGRKDESIATKATDTDVLIRLGGALAALLAGEGGAAAGLAGAGLLRASGEATAANKEKRRDIENADIALTDLASSQEAQNLQAALQYPDVMKNYGPALDDLTGVSGSYDMVQAYANEKQNRTMGELVIGSAASMPDDVSRRHTYERGFNLMGFTEPYDGFYDKLSKQTVTKEDFDRLSMQADPDSFIKANVFLAQQQNIGQPEILAAMRMLHSPETPESAANKSKQELIKDLGALLKKVNQYRIENPGETLNFADSVHKVLDAEELAKFVILSDNIDLSMLDKGTFADLLDSSFFNERFAKYVDAYTAINDQIKLQNESNSGQNPKKVLDEEQIRAQAIDRASKDLEQLISQTIQTRNRSMLDLHAGVAQYLMEKDRAAGGDIEYYNMLATDMIYTIRENVKKELGDVSAGELENAVRAKIGELIQAENALAPPDNNSYIMK